MMGAVAGLQGLLGGGPGPSGCQATGQHRPAGMPSQQLQAPESYLPFAQASHAPG